jgi:hypothetical protein
MIDFGIWERRKLLVTALLLTGVCLLSRKDHIGEPINYQYTCKKDSQEPEYTYLRQTLCRRKTHLIVCLFGMRTIVFREGRLRIANRCPECVLFVCLATHINPPEVKKNHIPEFPTHPTQEYPVVPLLHSSHPTAGHHQQARKGYRIPSKVQTPPVDPR